MTYIYAFRKFLLTIVFKPKHENDKLVRKIYFKKITFLLMTLRKMIKISLSSISFYACHYLHNIRLSTNHIFLLLFNKINCFESLKYHIQVYNKIKIDGKSCKCFICVVKTKLPSGVNTKHCCFSRK